MLPIKKKQVTEFELLRLISGEDATSGILYQIIESTDSSFNKPKKAICCIVEDEEREEKIRSETRIPAGRYELKWRQAPSRLTTKYRNKYSWFKWHIWLQNVPNFTYIYIHAGYSDDSSAGCLICGEMLVNVQIEKYKNGWTGGREDTERAYKRIYEAVEKALKEGKAFITIKDIG